jgi:hypothetical protein
MQALATPLVAILKDDSVFVFSRQEHSKGSTGYGVRRDYLATLDKIRPGSVFECGTYWQMVPAKLYNFSDSQLYLKQHHPLLARQKIGTTALPGLQAMGIYNRHTDVADEFYSGNHVAELFIHVATELSRRMPDLVLAFFVDKYCWFVIVRRNQLVYAQARYVPAHSDAIYHLAALLKQYGLNRETTPVILGGMLATEGQLYKQLSIYFDLKRLEDELAAGPHTAPVQLLLAFDATLRQEPSKVS